MGWTHDELQDTPDDFVTALLARWEVENKHQESERKKMQAKMKRPKRR